MRLDRCLLCCRRVGRCSGTGRCRRRPGLSPSFSAAAASGEGTARPAATSLLHAMSRKAQIAYEIPAAPAIAWALPATFRMRRDRKNVLVLAICQMLMGTGRSLLIATAPLIVSHANACGMLDNVRNLADDQIKAIAQQGGLRGILALPERGVKQQAPRAGLPTTMS